MTITRWAQHCWSKQVRVRAVLFGVLLALTAVIPVRADVRIRASSGGEVTQYLTLFELVRQSGERVVIDGPCLSACTLVLSTIPEERICVTHRAVFGFHAARAVDQYGHQFPASSATRLIAATYPVQIRAWIMRHGGLSNKLILLRGRELAQMYPPCR